MLIVLQPTAFCNIDCSYCYLPGRSLKGLMALSTVRQIFERLREAELLKGRVTVLWHVGEPLSAPISFYEQAFSIINEFARDEVDFEQSFQTNATLINDDWVSFISHHDVSVGVSIDGPPEIHDSKRITRSGRGTLGKSLAGVRLLQRRGIEVGNISVVSDRSLDDPEGVWRYLTSRGMLRLSFNIEEVEGINKASTAYSLDQAVERYKHFLRTIAYLRRDHRLDVDIRELRLGRERVLSEKPGRTLGNEPLEIVSFDREGNFSTFSPELLSLESEGSRPFIFGNVWDVSIKEALASRSFINAHRAILSGIERCRQECEYFSLCGGGEPINKFCENGTFDSSETMYCQMNVKAVVDICLEILETEFN